MVRRPAAFRTCTQRRSAVTSIYPLMSLLALLSLLRPAINPRQRRSTEALSSHSIYPSGSCAATTRGDDPAVPTPCCGAACRRAGRQCSAATPCHIDTARWHESCRATLALIPTPFRDTSPPFASVTYFVTTCRIRRPRENLDRQRGLWYTSGLRLRPPRHEHRRS